MYELKLKLPNWADSFLKTKKNIINESEEQIRFVLELTERNIRE